MRRFLIGALTTGAVAAAAIFATGAFFSDEETSTGNLLQAGEIDLVIDNHSYVDQTGNGLVENPGTTWRATDLTNQVFFNFTDLKPGDLGEDTISLHVSSNPAWVCANIDLTANDDRDCSEPEVGDDANCDPNVDPDADLFDGDLAQALNFIFWIDDGDNVFEIDETNEGDVTEKILTQGPASGVLNGAHWSLFDSQTGTGPTDPDQVYWIGKAWCFGNLTLDPVDQDDLGGQPNNGPDVRGAGVSCDGEPVNNAAQTDLLTGDITFRAVQSRHNSTFVCDERAEPIDQI